MRSIIPLHDITMLALGKLIGHAATRRGPSSHALAHQFLVRAGICLGMVIVAAFLIGGLIVGGLFAAYVALVAHGLSPDAALVSITAATLMLIAILALSVSVQCHKLQHRVHALIRQQIPFAGASDAVSDVTDAFMRGFNRPSRSKPNLVKKESDKHH